jgi:hypothetical protein
MAFVSAMAYKETRNRDGSVFSLQMEATVTLQPNELEFDLKHGAVSSAAGEMLIKYVSGELDHAAGSFQNAEKMLQEKPKQDPSKTPASPAVPETPKQDPSKTEVLMSEHHPSTQDTRPLDHPCLGCPEDPRCEKKACKDWDDWVKGGGEAKPPKTEAPVAPAAPAMSPKDIYKSQPKGPAVPAAPMIEALRDDKPVVVNCYVCGATCDERESITPPHRHYWYCPQCKKNRQKDGRPFPGQVKV